MNENEFTRKHCTTGCINWFITRIVKQIITSFSKRDKRHNKKQSEANHRTELAVARVVYIWGVRTALVQCLPSVFFGTSPELNDRIIFASRVCLAAVAAAPELTVQCIPTCTQEVNKFNFDKKTLKIYIS